MKKPDNVDVMMAREALALLRNIDVVRKDEADRIEHRIQAWQAGGVFGLMMHSMLSWYSRLLLR